MKLFSQGLVALSLIAVPASMMAGVIPYPNPGTIAPQVPTFATSSGGINVFYYGSGASFTDYVQVRDLQTGYNSGDVLNNHTTSLGAKLTLGTAPGQINAGDQLVFYIDSPDGLFASIAADSADGVNHAYITAYTGGLLNGVTIPPGLYVGLEDEKNGSSDFNYQDDTFVFSGVAAPSIATTPEPSSWMLLGSGLLGVTGFVRRKVRLG